MKPEQLTMKKTTSTARSNSGLQSCKKVSGENLPKLPSAESTAPQQKTFVPVAKFRQAYDALLRIVQVDYNACVYAGEVYNWRQIAEKCAQELGLIDCKRATETDRGWHKHALNLARAQIEKSVQREKDLAERMGTKKTSAQTH